MSKRITTAAERAVTSDVTAWTYCGVVIAVIWYVLKGSDDIIYLFWAMALFIHATAQRIIREIRLGDRPTP